MKTSILIEHENWKAFLDEFSRQYGGREVVVSLMTSHIVALRNTGVAQFNGIWIEERDAHSVAIMITLESKEHGLLTHTIDAPTFLSWDESQRVLFIEHRDGSTEVLQLHPCIS